MSITIGVAVADPAYGDEGQEMEIIDVGSAHDMADGSTVYDHVGSRYAWNLEWVRITKAEKDAIRARYLIKTTQSFTPKEDSTTYSVRVKEKTWHESYVDAGDGNPYYNCGMRLETVAVV